MEKILINIICDKLSVLKKINLEGVQLLQHTLRIKNQKAHIRAIVNESLIDTIKSVAKVEVLGAMKDIAREKQAMVNKGNRYK